MWKNNKNHLNWTEHNKFYKLLKCIFYLCVLYLWNRNTFCHLNFSDKWQLTIPGMVRSDEGNYSCIVHNQHGILTHTYRIEALTYLTHKPGKLPYGWIPHWTTQLQCQKGPIFSFGWGSNFGKSVSQLKVGPQGHFQNSDT